MRTHWLVLNWGALVQIWDLTTNSTQLIKENGPTVLSLKEINSQIFARAYSNEIRLSDITSGQFVRTLTAHTSAIGSMDLMNNGKTLVSGGQYSENNTIKIWDWTTGECLSTIQTTGSDIYSLPVLNSYESK
jgi:F-box and WD-40 domain protein MET30